ncbi:MAG TPA: outer membrane beta-barrel protein, partial [Aquaticitalea sp.]|nr:outer membrane beta-barrel protein [Aquaticitalea sp.]
MSFKKYIFFVLFAGTAFGAMSQNAKSVLKAQVALGLNSPSKNGFVAPFEAKTVNFPTITLGVQYMFKERFGAKFDYGFNRFSYDGDSPEFKDNYSRLNLQFVYDASTLGFLPERIGLVGHAGPGYTFVKPLGGYADNKLSFLNLMAGIEIHYGISDTMSLFADISYIYGLGKDFN